MSFSFVFLSFFLPLFGSSSFIRSVPVSLSVLSCFILFIFLSLHVYFPVSHIIFVSLWLNVKCSCGMPLMIDRHRSVMQICVLHGCCWGILCVDWVKAHLGTAVWLARWAGPLWIPCRPHPVRLLTSDVSISLLFSTLPRVNCENLKSSKGPLDQLQREDKERNKESHVRLLQEKTDNLLPEQTSQSAF